MSSRISNSSILHNSGLQLLPQFYSSVDSFPSPSFLALSSFFDANLVQSHSLSTSSRNYGTRIQHLRTLIAVHPPGTTGHDDLAATKSQYTTISKTYSSPLNATGLMDISRLRLEPLSRTTLSSTADRSLSTLH